MNNHKKYLEALAFTTEEFEGLPKNTFVRIVGYSVKDMKYNTIVEILNQDAMIKFGHMIWTSGRIRYNFVKNINLSSSKYYYVPFRILNFLSND